MRAEQHDDTLGPCPWCSSTEHWVYDEGSEDDRTERDFWAQCRECNQCSPSYPTIETLREGWAECRRGEQPAEVWVGPFANGARVWASRQDYLDDIQPDPDIDPRVFEPRAIPVIGAQLADVWVAEHHDRDRNAVIFATQAAALESEQAQSGIWNIHRRTPIKVKP
jgi:hypothetical protein